MAEPGSSLQAHLASKHSMMKAYFQNYNGRAGNVVLGLCPANERRRYEVTPSLIGWAQT